MSAGLAPRWLPRLAKERLRGLLPRTIKRHRILAGPLKGARIVTSWHNYPAAIAGNTEGRLVAWFAATVKLGETWLDVGAQYGYTSIALGRLVGRGGRVFAFEPVVATAAHLIETCRANGLAQVTVVPAALGAPDQLALLRLPTIKGMADSTIALGAWPESLLVLRLDWLWPYLCGAVATVSGVKIDVQGMEIEVLRGMQEVLRRWRPRLVVEVHPGVSRPELLAVLEAAGYERQGIAIEAQPGEEHGALYIDDRSYEFVAASA